MIRLSVLIIGLAGQANALSCKPHSVEQVYQDAAAATESYLVMHGALSFDGGLLPQTDRDPMARPQDAFIPARLVGEILSGEGFDAPAAIDLTFHVACFASWCGNGLPGAEYIAFVEQTATGYVLKTNPCGGYAFPKPTQAMVEAVERCHAGGACETPKRN